MRERFNEGVQLAGPSSVLERTILAPVNLYIHRRVEMRRLTADEIFEGLKGCINEQNAIYRTSDFALYHEARARIDQLEVLLRELIDIEGPQPGHVMWARKVQQTLGPGPLDCIHPGFDELGVCTCCKEYALPIDSQTIVDGFIEFHGSEANPEAHPREVVQDEYDNPRDAPHTDKPEGQQK